MRQMNTKHLDASRRQRPNLGLAIGPSGRNSKPAKPSGAGNGCANLPPASATQPPTFPERLLTAKEISPRLFIKPRTAALWARQGRIPAYRIGRKLGFKWEEVERALPTVSARCVPHGPSMPLAGLPRGPLGDC